jgi:hypothetical protein
MVSTDAIVVPDVAALLAVLADAGLDVPTGKAANRGWINYLHCPFGHSKPNNGKGSINLELGLYLCHSTGCGARIKVVRRGTWSRSASPVDLAPVKGQRSILGGRGRRG